MMAVNLKVSSLLEAAKTVMEANSSILVEGNGKKALNLMIKVYGDLLSFANEFYGSIDQFTDERLVHTLHVLLQRRIIEVTTFAIKASSYKSPGARDELSLRFIRNIGATDRSEVILDRLKELSENDGPRRRADRSDLPVGFPSGKLPQALNSLDTSKSDGFKSIIGIDNKVNGIRTRVRKTLIAHASAILVLHGPPGTGKTSLALAVGSEFHLPVLSISAAGLGGMYVGEKESNLSAIFAYVNAVTSDLVLFIDEADSFVRATSRGEPVGTRMVSKAIKDFVFDLVDNRKRSKTVILVMATNDINMIDESVRQLSVAVYIDLPDRPGMTAVVSFYRNAYMLNITEADMEVVAEECFRRRFSPSNVNLLFRRVASSTVYRLLTEPLGRVALTDSGQILTNPIYTLGDVAYSGEQSQASLITFSTNKHTLPAGELRKTDLMPALSDGMFDYDSVKPAGNGTESTKVASGPYSDITVASPNTSELIELVGNELQKDSIRFSSIYDYFDNNEQQPPNFASVQYMGKDSVSHLFD